MLHRQLKRTDDSERNSGGGNEVRGESLDKGDEGQGGGYYTPKSIVWCYRCGLMGHLQYTCTSPSTIAAAGVENGHGILPVPAHMGTNQNGKCPTTEILQGAKKPAMGDGAKYGKPYWLAELEKVKERWGTGVDASKGKGGGQESLGIPGQGDRSTKGKAPLWMVTGKGGFDDMSRHGDRRIVELGPDGKPIDQ